MVTPIYQTIQASLTHAIPSAISQKLSTDNPIFVACSGGRDSMALLYLLHQQSLPIVALHINHGIQAPSHHWENLVQNFCQCRHIPFLSKRLTFKNLENINEQQARYARYQAITALIQDYFLPNIICHTPILALAHHANDQAETVLMRLCYGAGLQGLSGMPEWTLQHEFSQPLYLWRPLLVATREQISEFVIEQNLPYVDDPTNITGDNQRALIRQHILPTLAQMNNLQMSKLVQNIARSSHNLAEASQILDEQAQVLLENCQQSSWTTALSCLDIDKLRTLSEVQRFYVLHFWLKQHMNFAPPRRFIEQVNQLILSDNLDHQSILQWDSQQIRRYRGNLYLLSERYIALLVWSENVEEGTKIIANTPLSCCVNLTQIHDFYFIISLKFKQPVMQTLNIRQIKSGEKFRLFNRPHHQTFKNICQSLSIPSWERCLARVIDINFSQDKVMPLAVIFPSHTVWLASGENLGANKVSMLFEKDAFHKR